MSDANYSIVSTTKDTPGSPGAPYYTNVTSTGFSITTRNPGGTAAVRALSFAVHDNEPAEIALTTFGDVINWNGAAAWGRGEGDGTLLSGLNIASVTRTASGKYDVVFTTPMPDANYAVIPGVSSGNQRIPLAKNQTATGFTFELLMVAGNAVDAEWSFTVNALNALPPKGGTGTDAWASVQADGTINASFNVASVTNSGTGFYDVVFTTPMPTANYSVTASPSTVADTNVSARNLTANGFTVTTYDQANSAFDNFPFCFSVNATNAQLPDTFTIEQFNDLVARVTALENA